MLIDVTDTVIDMPRHWLRQPTLEEMAENATGRDYDAERTVEAGKVCVQCGEPYLATTEYWDRHPTTRDRLDTRCKECKKQIWVEKKAKWKQERYQAAHKASGLCRSCSNPAVGLFCPSCLEKDRTRNRNRYRLKHGIPLDAPPMRTRPRNGL